MNTHKVTLKYLKNDALVFEFEQALYLIADNFLVGYNGGSWTAKDFKKGFFWALNTDELMDIKTPGGSYAEQKNSEFVGLAITQMTLCYLLEKNTSNAEKFELFETLFYNINDYIFSDNFSDDFKDAYFALMD